MEKFLQLVKGRKSSILTVLALFITYALTKGYIGDAEAVLFNGILVVFGLTANLLDSHYGTNTRVGLKK
jgi:hypothetical protein